MVLGNESWQMEDSIAMSLSYKQSTSSAKCLRPLMRTSGSETDRILIISLRVLRDSAAGV